MKARALLLLRLSVAYLLVIWGADKLVNPAHGVVVSGHFYGGLFGGRGGMSAHGTAQIVLGAALALGIGHRYVNPSWPRSPASH